MGLFWAVVHPLVLLLCYTFVFSIVFKIRAGTLATGNFAIFLFCGILPWLYFQDTVLRCCNSVVENSNLIKKTVFPSEILPISLALSNVVTHLFGLAILLIVLVFSGLLVWTSLFLPVYLFLLVVLSLGLGWLCAALQVFLRDTYQVVSVGMVLWFWFTPIFYSVEMVPSRMRMLILFNPLSYVVEGYRNSLLEGRLPDLGHLLVLLGFALFVFVLGGYVFRNTKREFIDVI
jgi:ABC-type polysaccharide/polyol phosphate export permease